jgi:hypothetical protein
VCLSNKILDYMKIYGLSFLDRIRNLYGQTYWLQSSDLGLVGEDAISWDTYVSSLGLAGIILSYREDRLLWSGNEKSGIVTAKDTYDRIMQEKYIFPQHWWYKKLWKWNIALKHKCFLWHALQGTLKTWDNLAKRGWNGPNWCILCQENCESINHLFVFCSFGKKVWDFCCSKMEITKVWEKVDLGEALLSWSRDSRETIQVPIFISWALWYFRNLITF